MQRIIGLIGEMAAGKTTATNYLKQEFGAVTFKYSDALRDVLKRLGIEPSRNNLQDLSTMLRQRYGEGLLANAMRVAVDSSPAPLIIVEGIRRPSDLGTLKDLPGFSLIYLSVPERLRYERLTQRRENADDATKTWEQFQADGKQESEQEIGAIAKAASVTIDNSGSLEQLQVQLKNLLA